MRIVLPKERPISWNEFYKGHHWSFRKLYADQVHQSVRDALLEAGILKPQIIPFKVNILIIAYFSKSPLDSDNIPAKLFVDGLKGIILENDSMQFVGTVATRSDIDERNPRIEILIEKDIVDK